MQPQKFSAYHHGHQCTQAGRHPDTLEVQCLEGNHKNICVPPISKRRPPRPPLEQISSLEATVVWLPLDGFNARLARDMTTEYT
jgi:hypothetical protein